jgi:hypothetical protein
MVTVIFFEKKVTKETLHSWIFVNKPFIYLPTVKQVKKYEKAAWTG